MRSIPIFLILTASENLFHIIIPYILMQNKHSAEQPLKLIIIGDCGVGKTNILVQFCENSFRPNYVATIGVDFKIKTITVRQQRIKLQIWDTAGQERFKNITQAYYKRAAGILMIYAIDDARSFENIERWMQQINEHAPKDVVKILAGNKLDLQSDRVVQLREGQALANKNDIPFMEVSAKTGENVKDLFQKVGEVLLNDYLPNRIVQRQRYSLRSNASLAQIEEKRNCEC